jgi:hypothetical protein
MNVQLYTPHKKQQQVESDNHRYKVLNWGRRTGKSTLAVMYTFRRAIRKPGRYFIVAPTYRQAKSIYWNDIIKQHIPKDFIAKYNEQELTVTLKPIELVDDKGEKIKPKKRADGNLEHSTIELKGAENEESLRGVKLRGAVMDECAFMPNFDYVWTQIIRPALGDQRGWCIFISTPNGVYNHFYELVQKAKELKTWFFSHATALDNPYFPPEEFEEARKTLPEDEFAQEWQAEFRKTSTLVYRDFSEEVHVVTPEDQWKLPSTGTNMIGIDFGYTNPFAGIFVRIDNDNNWWIYDEVYRSEMDTEQAIDALRAKMGNTHFTHIIGDSAAANEIGNFKKRNFPIKGAKKGKDSVKAGIRLVAEKLKVQEGTGKPKMFIMSNCKNTIREFMSYSYPQRMEELITLRS